MGTIIIAFTVFFTVAASIGLVGIFIILFRMNHKAQAQAVAQMEESKMFHGIFKKVVKAVGGREV